MRKNHIFRSKKFKKILTRWVLRSSRNFDCKRED